MSESNESADRPAQIELTDAVITPQMIEAGVAVLRDSGRLAFEATADHQLVAHVLEASLRAAR